MKVLSVLLFAAAALLALLCLLLVPRRGYPGWEELSAFRYAHRGLHDVERGIPENSLSAFRAAAEKGFGAELDVHLLADGKLAVVHDSDLKRVCGADVRIEELSAADLPRYPLLGSGETIPLLEEVLEVFAGRAPLVIELKVAGGNAYALADATMRALEGWQGRFCLESFHPLAVYRLRRCWPQVIRGQLAQNFFRSSETGRMSWPVAFLLTNLLTTAFTRPDFIAYKSVDRGWPTLRLMKRLYGVHEVGWTIRGREELLALEKEGVVPIFEGFVP